jgi:5-methylcytosine-specific restriction endonuclease McrA
MPLRALRKLFGIAQASHVATPEAFKVFERDHYTCRYCGLDGRASFENWLVLTVDFVHPRVKGGKKSDENLVTACQPCNVIKGSHRFKTFEEARDYVLKRREEWRGTFDSQMRHSKQATAAHR